MIRRWLHKDKNKVFAGAYVYIEAGFFVLTLANPRQKGAWVFAVKDGFLNIKNGKKKILHSYNVDLL